jgi:hypothetical protein
MCSNVSELRQKEESEFEDIAHLFRFNNNNNNNNNNSNNNNNEFIPIFLHSSSTFGIYILIIQVIIMYQQITTVLSEIHVERFEFDLHYHYLIWLLHPIV